MTKAIFNLIGGWIFLIVGYGMLLSPLKGTLIPAMTFVIALVCFSVSFFSKK